jgi:hypothetical protein
VLRTITEIVLELIGAERFAIYALDERRGELRALAAEGVPLAGLPAWRLGEGRIGAAVAGGAVARFEAPAGADAAAAEPLVVVPLRVGERALGAIAIFGLLPQKPGLTPLDAELFEVLAGHAATAIFAARLHATSERKLGTLQGFIDLLSR